MRRFQFDASFEARPLHRTEDVLLDLDRIESALKLLLPAELRDLFEQFRAAIIFDQKVEFLAPHCIFSNEAGRIGLELINGPVDGDYGIVRRNEQLSCRLPEWAVVFAEIAGGNMLLIDRRDHGVSVWLHDEVLSSRVVTPIYAGFRDFLDALVRIDAPPLRSIDELGLDLKAMGLTKE